MARTFYVGKSKLEISNDLEEYNKFRHAFLPLADEAARKFEMIYKKENHSLSGLVKNFDHQVMEAITPVLNQCTKLLFDQGIFDVDKDTFLNRYCTKYITVIDSFQKFVDKYYQILGDKEAARMYRNQRKASRGMFVGGGFGLEGAVKGMATAGALNIASGFMHSIANGIGNMFSNAECRRKMDAVFNHPDTLEELKDSVWESAFHMHYAYLDVLEEKTGGRIHKFEPDDYQKAEAICKNIASLQPDFESVQPAICQMLKAHPYEFDFYCLIIAQYGDENNQLQEIGEFFHIDIDAIKIYIYDTIIKKIDFKTVEDMEQVISNAESYGVHFGVKKSVIEETSNRIRNAYNEYLLSASYYEKRKVYLSDKIKRNDLDNALDNCQQICSSYADEAYDAYLKGSEGCYTCKHIQEDPKMGKYRKYLFIMSEDKLNQSFKFRISYNLIEYGRGKCIRVSDVNKIKVENSRIIMNDAYSYQCTRPQKDADLEEFLRNLIRKIQETYSNSVTKILELEHLFDASGTDILKKVTDYIKNNAKAIAKINSEYNIFNEADADKMIVINNIARKLEYYGVDRKGLNPVLWFNISHVSKNSEDSLVATEEFNEEKYRVDSNDYVLLTSKYLYFTNANIKIETDKIRNLILNGRNIELPYGDSTLRIAECKYADAKELKILLENIVSIIKNGNAAAMSYDPEKDKWDQILCDCSNMLYRILLKRTKEDEREKFLRFIAVNYENEYFEATVADYVDNYSLGEYINPEDILFFIKNTEAKCKEAIFFTKDKIIIAWKGSDGTIKIDDSRDIKDAESFSIIKGKQDAVGTRGKKVAFTVQLKNNSYVSCYESDCSIEYNRTNVCEAIANEVLWHLQEAMGLPVTREAVNFFEFLADEYKRCGLDTIDHDKIMFLRYLSDKFEQKQRSARENFAFYSDDENVIFIFDDSITRSMGSGFVLTDKHLYHKELPNKNISLANIEELQFNSGFFKAIVVISSTGEKYELGYTSSLDTKNGLMDFLTTAIFYLKEHPDAAIAGIKEIEKFIEDSKKKEKEKQALRNLPGVFLEAEKNIIDAAKRKCAEYQLPMEGQNAFTFRGSSSFDQALQRMKNSGNYYKIDNIEVPLMLFYKESDYTGGFIITSEALYTCAGVVARSSRIPLSLVERIGYEEVVMSNNIYASVKDDYNTYKLCKLAASCDVKKYRDLIEFVIKQLQNAADIIEESKKTLSTKIDELKDLYRQMEAMSMAELNELAKKLKEFPEIFQDEIKELKKKLETVEFEGYLSNVYPELESMDKNRLKMLLKEIEAKALHSDTINTYQNEFSNRLVAIETEEMQSLCSGMDTMDKSSLKDLLDRLNNDFGPSDARKEYISSCKKRINEIELEEIRQLCSGTNGLSREECLELKEKLRIYNPVLTNAFIDEINNRINLLENEALSKLCADYNMMNRDQIVALEQNISSLGYSMNNAKDYLEKLHERLIECDNQTLSDMCKNISELGFHEGLQLLNQITAMDVLEEVKKSYIEKLDDYLLQLKKAEMAKYLSLIANLGILSDRLGIPDGRSADITRKYQTARSKYAKDIKKYEIPILLNDTTMLGGGEEGFLLTNENIYYNGKTVQTTKLPLDQILRFDLEKKMLGGSSMCIVLKNGYTVSIPNKINKEQLPNLLAILNRLIYEMYPNRAQNQINPQMNGYSQNQASPQMNGYSQNQASPQMNGYSQNQASPQMNGSYHNQGTPQMNGNHQNQIDPQMNGSHQNQVNPQMNSQMINSTGDQLICNQCGKSYTPGQKFCRHCGNRLEIQADAAANASSGNQDNHSYANDKRNIWQYCYEELMKTGINKPIGYVSIPGFMPKFEKKFTNAVKAYAAIGNEQPVLLFDTTIFESGKEGFLLTNQNLYAKYTVGKPVKYPLRSIKAFEPIMEGNSVRVGIEIVNGIRQLLILSNSNQAEAYERCSYLNKVLHRLKEML